MQTQLSSCASKRDNDAMDLVQSLADSNCSAGDTAEAIRLYRQRREFERGRIEPELDTDSNFNETSTPTQTAHLQQPCCYKSRASLIRPSKSINRRCPSAGTILTSYSRWHSSTTLAACARVRANTPKRNNCFARVWRWSRSRWPERPVGRPTRGTI